MRRVSIIIPVYNAEKYLEKCIQSACSQTYSELEIICVDDGSSDLSAKILDDCKSKDSRIKVIRQSNHGESAARNRGLGAATGDYIGFMDCDDWIEPEMYENLVREIEGEGADIAISGWYSEEEGKSTLIKNEKKVDGKVFSGEKLLRYLYERDSYRSFAYMWDKLYKREILTDGDGCPILFDEGLRLGGDVLFLGRVALNVRKAVYTDKAFYHYRQRPDSGCHTNDLDKRKDWLAAYLKLIDIYEKKKIDEQITGLLKRFLVYHSANTARMAHEQHDEEALRHCKKIMERYKKEYVSFNQDKPERLAWLEEIMSY